MKTQLNEMCEMQPKQCLEENLQHRTHLLEMEEDSKINYLRFYHKKLRKEEQYKQRARK